MEIRPEFVSGFVNSDGCFCVLTEMRGKTPYYRPTFYCSQQGGKERSPLLVKCQEFFGGGHWADDPRDNSTSLCINSQEMVRDVIIPHFNRWPLQGEKARDFRAWKKICQILQRGGGQGLQSNRKAIEKLISGMNRTSNRWRKKKSRVEEKKYLADLTSLPETWPGPRLDPEFVSGFVQGDGGFHFSFNSNPLRARPSFACGQHVLSRPLLLGIQEFFGAGTVYRAGPHHWRWSVDVIGELREKIVPHFLRHPLRDEKLRIFSDFQRGLELLVEPGLSRRSRLLQLVDLLYESNRGGKRRRLPRAEYVSLVEKLREVQS